MSDESSKKTDKAKEALAAGKEKANAFMEGVHMKRNYTLMALLICALVIGLIACQGKNNSGTTTGTTQASTQTASNTNTNTNASVPSGRSQAVAETEPNDSERIAQLINIGDTVNGTFSHADDQDFYKFVITQAGKVTAFTESNIDIYNLNIELLDSDGDFDTYISNGGYISGYEGDRRVEAILQPGTYALELEGYEPGAYVLKTQFEASASAPSTATAPSTSTATTAQTPRTASSASTDWDKLLTDYEKYVDDYIALMVKATAGDMTAMLNASQLLEQSTALSERLINASGELNTQQLRKLEEISMKMVDAASSLY